MTSTNQETQPEAAQEIAHAIRMLTTTSRHELPAEIRILPTMQECRYRHTCPKCGCHTATTLWTQPDPYEPLAKICVQCQHVYEHNTQQAV